MEEEERKEEEEEAKRREKFKSPTQHSAQPRVTRRAPRRAGGFVERVAA